MVTPGLRHQTFTLSDAAAVFDMKIADLRNNVARGIYKRLGPAPLPGKEREFALVGLFEIGVIKSLSENGLTLAQASSVVDRSLQTVRVIVGMEYMQQGIEPERAFEIVDQRPELLLRYDWAHADLQRPSLWVFLFDKAWGPTLENAMGWDDVGRAAREVIIRSYPVLVPMVGRDAPGTDVAALAPPEAWILTQRPHLHVFNLTAALTSIEHAIDAKLGILRVGQNSGAPIGARRQRCIR